VTAPLRPAALAPVRSLTRRARPAPLLLELDLSRGLLESPPADPLGALRARQVPSLRTVLERLRAAADETSVVGLVAHVGPDVLSPAQVEEVGRAVEAFAKAGKHTACWTESFGELGSGTLPYHLAVHFDELWVQPSASVGLVGVATRGVFLRGALDRLGLEPQIGQRHEYKSAADTIVRESMSDAQREATQRLADSVTEQVVATVSRRRDLSPEQVRAAIDGAPLNATAALEHRLVDRIGYRDELYADLRRRLGRPGDGPPELRLRYVHRWSPSSRRQARALAARRHRPVVAVVAVEGGIALGRSGSSPLGGRRAGSDTVCAALRAAASRADVKAVVLRVVSPGGSYVASDAIHREVLQVRSTGKPVVASMGTVAASGGYFVAMPADEVLALPSTVTGSIGVLGGKVVVGEALRRVGIGTEPVGSGEHAVMFDPTRRFDDDEWRRVETWLDEVYDDFTRKAAAGRGLPYERLEPLARGRVWTGADAYQLGLVDTLGGLPAAVECAARRAGLQPDRVRVQPLPHVTPFDRLRAAESSDSPAAAGASGLLAPAGAGLDGTLTGLWEALGGPGAGVLSVPGDWRLR